MSENGYKTTIEAQFGKDIQEVLLNDEIILHLSRELAKLYDRSTPRIILKPNGEVICKYDDDFYRIESHIKKELEFRKQQIMNHFKR